MKIKILDSLLMLLLIIIIVFGFYSYNLIKSKAGECANNPLVYGINFYNEKLKTEMTCTCSFSKGNYVPFIITKEGINPIKDIAESNNTYKEVNWSNIKLKENE